MEDFVQKIIEGTLIENYDLIGDPFIDKCSFCGDYKRIVSQNCWGIPMLCIECYMKFYEAEDLPEPALKNLRLQYKEKDNEYYVED